MTKLFRYLMALLVINLARILKYTPAEVLEMYDRAESGLPTISDETS